MSSGTQEFSGSYVRRVVDDELDVLLPELPALLLDGPKGVGKTATALQRCRTVRRLDQDSHRALAEADPDAALRGDPPVLLDEWHRVPAVWDAVKRRVDADPRQARFLLTGSADLAGTTTHSGAGRIATLRMRPLTLAERGVATPQVGLAGLLSGGRSPVGGGSGLTLLDYVNQILASGFPGMLHLSTRSSRIQLDGYLERVVDRDLDEAGLRVRRPASVTAWLRAYAAATATTASYERIRDAATGGTSDKPAKTTTLGYIEALTGLRVLDPVPAWVPSGSHLSRLTGAPKHHLADPALAARLLGLDRDALASGQQGSVEMPRDGTFLGALFESLATLSVRVFAQAAEARVFHLRTQQGRHEVDLVVVRDDGRVLALEVKLSTRVDDRDVRHLAWLAERLGDRLLDAAVLTIGPEAYRRRDGVAVVPLALLGP